MSVAVDLDWVRETLETALVAWLPRQRWFGGGMGISYVRCEELAPVELAVEDIPVLPHTWVAPRVPLASLVPATQTTPPRLVLFRRPIEHRAESRADLEALVLTVVVEQLADYLGVPAEDVHPDYEP